MSATSVRAGQNSVTNRYAVIADIDVWPGDNRLHLMLTFVAERAVNHRLWQLGAPPWLCLDCLASFASLANASLDPPRQFLVARGDYAHHPLGFQVVRARCSDQNLLGAGSQLVREQ